MGEDENRGELRGKMKRQMVKIKDRRVNTIFR